MPNEKTFCEPTTVLELSGVCVRYPGARSDTLCGLDLCVPPKARMAIVGESGSGKTTLLRTLLGLLAPAAGEVRWFGEDIFRLPRARLAALRARVQPVFQDPMASFDPRYSCLQVIEEPLLVHERLEAGARWERCREIVRRVGLDESVLDTFPRKLSGGQRQRLAIARAMVLSPQVLVADEPTAALDLSVQGQIVRLLLDLHRSTDLGLVVISHDFPLVSQLCETAAVLYAGRIVEEGPLTQVFTSPLHPYTQDLVQASTGDLPPADAPLPASPAPDGCPYRTRCRRAAPACLQSPPSRLVGTVRVSCHFA